MLPALELGRELSRKGLSGRETSPGQYPVTMQCDACSHVILQGRGQISSGNILTDVILFQTQIPLLMYTDTKQENKKGDSNQRRNTLPSVNSTLRLEHRAKHEVISSPKGSILALWCRVSPGAQAHPMLWEMDLGGQEPINPRRSSGQCLCLLGPPQIQHAEGYRPLRGMGSEAGQLEALGGSTPPAPWGISTGGKLNPDVNQTALSEGWWGPAPASLCPGCRRPGPRSHWAISEELCRHPLPLSCRRKVPSEPPAQSLLAMAGCPMGRLQAWSSQQQGARAPFGPPATSSSSKPAYLLPSFPAHSCSFH